jgi:L-lactate utilization protein LutC
MPTITIKRKRMRKLIIDRMVKIGGFNEDYLKEVSDADLLEEFEEFLETIFREYQESEKDMLDE